RYPRRRGDRLLERERRLLRLLDALRSLGGAERRELLAQLRDRAAARVFLGHLAHGREGHGLSNERPARDGLAFAAESEPAPPLAAVERAQVDAFVPDRLHRQDAAQRFPLGGQLLRTRRDPRQLVAQRHRASIDSSAVAEAVDRTRHARALFAPLGPTYDRYAPLLSFGQDPRWRALLVSPIPQDARSVLDVATGGAAVAIELVEATPQRRVIGVDQGREMLAAGRERVARAGLADRVELREGSAEALPFSDASFEALTFTYLLRY